MTNVSREDGPVKPVDVIEISGLLAQVIRAGQAARGASGGATGGSGSLGAGHESGTATADAGGAVAGVPSGTALPSPHVIRAAIYIHEHGPQTVGQLAKGLETSQGWTSRIVDELERAGYVEKTRDPADRRIVRVGLTPMASERVERAARWRGDAVEAALADMTPGERAAVATFLRRFLEGSRAAG